MEISTYMLCLVILSNALFSKFWTIERRRNLALFGISFRKSGSFYIFTECRLLLRSCMLIQEE